MSCPSPIPDLGVKIPTLVVHFDPKVIYCKYCNLFSTLLSYLFFTNLDTDKDPNPARGPGLTYIKQGKYVNTV